MAKKTMERKEKESVEIPAGAKYIMVFEQGGKLGLASGGFVNADEMLGFNRRALNPNVTEQFIIAGVQQQAQEQAKKQRAIDRPPEPKVEAQEK